MELEVFEAFLDSHEGTPAPKLVEFVHEPGMLRWCPFAAVVLAGEDLKTLDLETEGAWERFASVITRNEICCMLCATPRKCTPEGLNYRGLAVRLRCEECGFRFTWYAGTGSLGVYDETDDSLSEDLRNGISKLCCGICREELLQPIQHRPKLVRVVCRSRDCAVQWGIHLPPQEEAA